MQYSHTIIRLIEPQQMRRLVGLDIRRMHNGIPPPAIVLRIVAPQHGHVLEVRGVQIHRCEVPVVAPTDLSTRRDEEAWERGVVVRDSAAAVGFGGHWGCAARSEGGRGGEEGEEEDEEEGKRRHGGLARGCEDGVRPWSWLGG
jgi:hypothetical protein